jgi:hypothetical protein
VTSLPGRTELPDPRAAVGGRNVIPAPHLSGGRLIINVNGTDRGPPPAAPRPCHIIPVPRSDDVVASTSSPNSRGSCPVVRVPERRRSYHSEEMQASDYMHRSFSVADRLGGGRGPPLLCGLLEVTRILLESGADVNETAGECGNALQAASRGGHEEVVQQLQKASADTTATAVYTTQLCRQRILGSRKGCSVLTRFWCR